MLGCYKANFAALQALTAEGDTACRLALSTLSKRQYRRLRQAMESMDTPPSSEDGAAGLIGASASLGELAISGATFLGDTGALAVAAAAADSMTSGAAFLGDLGVGGTTTLPGMHFPLSSMPAVVGAGGASAPAPTTSSGDPVPASTYFDPWSSWRPITSPSMPLPPPTAAAPGGGGATSAQAPTTSSADPAKAATYFDPLSSWRPTTSPSMPSPPSTAVAVVGGGRSTSAPTTSSGDPLPISNCDDPWKLYRPITSPSTPSPPSTAAGMVGDGGRGRSGLPRRNSRRAGRSGEAHHKHGPLKLHAGKGVRPPPPAVPSAQMVATNLASSASSTLRPF